MWRRLSRTHAVSCAYRTFIQGGQFPDVLPIGPSIYFRTVEKFAMTCGLIPATILHAVLGSAIPGGCFGDKSTESCSALQLFRIPPHFCFCHQMNSWPSEGEGRGCLSPLDFESISKKMLFFQFRGVKTKFHHKFWPPLEKSLGKSPTGPSWKKSLRRPWMNL